MLGGAVVFCAFHFGYLGNQAPKVVVHKDDNGRTFCDVYRPDGIKSRTVTIYQSFDDDKRGKSRSLAWTEDDLDNSGEAIDTRWYNALGNMYMRSQSFGKDTFATTTYWQTGNLKSRTEGQPGKPRTYTAYRKDGATVWYVYTDGDGGTPDTCEVRIDRHGAPCNRKFTRTHIKYELENGALFSISQGDEPKAYCQDSYLRWDGTLAYRQTWFAVWTDSMFESVEALGTIEVFDDDGKTLLKSIHIPPGSSPVPVERDSGLVTVKGVIIDHASGKADRSPQLDLRITEPLPASDHGNVLIQRHYLEGFHIYLGPDADNGG